MRTTSEQREQHAEDELLRERATRRVECDDDSLVMRMMIKEREQQHHADELRERATRR